MRDLRSRGLIYAKAGLFLVIGFLSFGLIIATIPSPLICVLLLLAIWSFCRAYYFAFYVIEKYIDPSFRYSGLFSALKHLLTNRSGYFLAANNRPPKQINPAP
jgi:hypothetical protein